MVPPPTSAPENLSNLAPLGSVEGTGRIAPIPVPEDKLSQPLPPQLLANLAALPSTKMLPAALRTLRGQTGGLGWFYLRFEAPVSPETEGKLTIEHRSTPEEDGKSIGSEVLSGLYKAALQAGLLACQKSDFAMADVPMLGQKARAEACPVLDRGRVLGAVCRVAMFQKKQASPKIALQCVAQLAVLVTVRGEAEQDRGRFQEVAAFIELFGAADSGTDFPECSRHLANHLRDIIGCDLVALAVRRWGRDRLVAVSGLAQTSAEQTAGRSALEACMGEAMRRKQMRTFRRLQGQGAIEDGSVQEVREWFDPALGIAAPLEDNNGVLRGGWIFLWQHAPDDPAEREILIRAASTEIAPLIHLLRKAKPGPLIGSLRRVWNRASANQQRLFLVAAVALSGILAFPVPYPIRAACELQPVTRRVVAAPFDGILQLSKVRAGEKVTAGQVLAEMEGREIRWQLADSAARKARAQAGADQALAAGKVAEARMSELEANSLEQEIAVLEYRAENLLIKAPLDGIVLQGDLERSEGAPLRVGDSLFEVGPLDRLVVELAVRETDIAMLRNGAPVQFTLESFPGETFDGTLLRTAPRSEPREGENVFICEMELTNPEGRLRPGLKGKGRIEGPRRPFIWGWLRDAWNALRFLFW